MAAFQLIPVIGAVSLLICTASLIFLHFLPTGFHPLSDPVSNYAVSRYGFLYRLQAFSSGICGLYLLFKFTESGIVLPFLGMAALLFYALSRLLIIFFPTDIIPPRTFKGTLHIILAAFTFAGIAISTGVLTPALTSLTAWSNTDLQLRAATLLTDTAAILFLAVFTIRPFRKIVGLIERCIYLGTLLWLGFVYLQLLKMG
jgi:hypothetical protein